MMRKDRIGSRNPANRSTEFNRCDSDREPIFICDWAKKGVDRDLA